MADSFILYLVDSVRSQMRALDCTLAMLESQISQSPQVDNTATGPVCPKCDTPLGENDLMRTMGHTDEYLCPNCKYCGKV